RHKSERRARGVLRRFRPPLDAGAGQVQRAGAGQVSGGRGIEHAGSSSEYCTAAPSARAKPPHLAGERRVSAARHRGVPRSGPGARLRSIEAMQTGALRAIRALAALCALAAAAWVASPVEAAPAPSI